jgi:precorrin-6A/cobalt-precorrin-6A reductase
MKRLLILGGTGDGVELARQAMSLPGLEVISSLAGRTSTPKSLVGSVRIGGFGGEAGLVKYLETEQIDLLIDATHPFAAKISGNAAGAARRVAVSYTHLTLPTTYC